MHPSLAHQTHRPWPIPKRSWSWRQSWLDALFLHWPFLHWPVPAEHLQPLVPQGLRVQSFEGTNPVAVWAARALFYLPYYRCAIDFTETPTNLHFKARRAVGAVRFQASVDIVENTMAEPYGLQLQGEPLCHFSRGVDVIVWSADAVTPA